MLAVTSSMLAVIASVRASCSLARSTAACARSISVSALVPVIGQHPGGLGDQPGQPEQHEAGGAHADREETCRDQFRELPGAHVRLRARSVSPPYRLGGPRLADYRPGRPGSPDGRLPVRTGPGRAPPAGRAGAAPGAHRPAAPSRISLIRSDRSANLASAPCLVGS